MIRNISRLVLMSSLAQAFVLPPSLVVRTTTSSTLYAAGKGFGDKPTPPSSSKKKSVADVVIPKDDTRSSSSSDELETSPTEINPFPAEKERDISLGKAALDRMRRERAEKRNEELQRIKQVKDVDEMLRESPEAAVIPEKVAQRMGSRMIPFVGIPLFGGMAAFVGFWYMATYQNVEFEPSVVAATTIILLAVGLMGITYSVMSASWDPDREGTLTGTEEFQRNVENIKEGLSRSRENARLRDRMDELDDFQQPVKQKREISFDEKIGSEMD